jgi:hypothetical protein
VVRPAEVEIAAVTSCGALPKTGNIWSVLPDMGIRSDADWGKSVAAFAVRKAGSEQPQSLAIVKENKIFQMNWVGWFRVVVPHTVIVQRDL